MKIKIVYLFLVLVLLLPYVVGAQTSTNPCGQSGQVGQCMSQIYLWSIGVSGLLAVASFVWGAFLYMTSRGNGAQVSSGRSYMFSALLGIALLAGAYILLNTLNTDLTNFNVNINTNQSAPRQ